MGTIREQENRDNDPIFLPNEDIKIPIEDDKLIQMQRKDKFCKNLFHQLESGKLSQKNPYYICEGLKPPLESFSRIDHAVIVMSSNY